MTSAIEILNHWGGTFLDFARSMFWQSSVLVLVLLALDFGLRHRVRAAVRHGLWLVLLVKLVLPTDLALPTSPAWWWSRANAVPVLAAPVVAHNYVVTQTDVLTPDISAPDWVEPPPVRPALTLAAGSLLLAGVVSLGLLGWLLWRWRQVVRASRAALPDAELALRLGEARELTRLRSPVPVRLTQATMSPAVCGLFRPVILLPRALAETLAPEQLRAVLLHELMHVRRRDVWVNLAQSLLQIFYWWHPLVWLANARIRRVREEAVDEAVMVALRGEADIYAPTLLAVAKFALHRPRLSLGLLGIMESRSALRQRIERLVTLPVPRRAGLGVLGALGIVAFSAVALPMGDAPPLPVQAAPEIAPASAKSTPWPDPRFEGYRGVNLVAHFLIVNQAQLPSTLRGLVTTLNGPCGISAADVDEVFSQLRQAGARSYNAYPGGVTQGGISGAWMHYLIGGGTNTGGMTTCVTTNVGGRNIIAGFEMAMPATQPDWTPMDLTLDPWLTDTDTRCELELTVGGQVQTAKPFEVFIPLGAAVAWGVPIPAQPGKSQVVLVMAWDATKEAAAGTFVKQTFPVRIADLQAAWQARGWSTNGDTDPWGMIYSFIYDAGLNWLPPRSFTYTNDLLEVRAPAADVTVIAKMVKTINQASPVPAPASAPSTEPPANPRPLISYILLAETGLPKLRQETGLTADSPPADYLAAFNKLLAASGNALPSNSLWLGDQGILLVRAEPAELGALGHLFRDLNGPDPSAGSRSASATPSAPVRSTAVASPSAPPAVADTNLFMRTFKINTNIFYTAVRKALGTNVPIAPKALADSLRDLFGRFGVDLARPKALLYNDRLGLLFVKATGEDLQVIERVAESLDEPTAEQRRLLRMATPLNHSNGVVGAGIPAPAQAGGSPEMNTQEPAITYQPDAAGNPGATSLPASGLVQDGKLLYEMGKLAEAEAKLTAALKLDPNNVAAFYYLNLIQQAQFAHSVTNQISPGRQAILHKLESIQLDTLNVDGLPLSEVLRQISEQAKLHDPEKKGINFLINPHTDLSATSTATLDPATGLPLTAAAAAPADQVDVGSTVIKFHLAEVRLADVLDAIVLVAERPIKYSIQDYAVVFSPKSPDATDLYSRTFKISVDDLRQGLGLVGPVDTLGGKSPTEAVLEQLRVYMSAQGVNLSPPKALFYNGRLGLLFVKASETDLDVVEKVVESWLRVTVPPPPLRPDLHSVDKMVDSWSNPAPAPSGPTSQEAATVTATNAPDVNQLMIDAMTLYESGHGDEARLKLVQVLRQDPANPAALYYWRLVHASHPAAAETNLFMRTFKVSPGLWESALAFPGETNFVITALRAGRFGLRLQLYLHFLGVEVFPPKSVFYNDRLGLLFMKATAADLDKVEQAISQLSNTNAPPGTSSFQLSSPTTTNNTALGFTWYASQFGSNLLPQTATSPAPATITGILSNPNFQAAIHALKQRSGVENLPEPEVTTTSGRQAHMRGSVMSENVFAAPMLDVPIHNRPQLHIKAYFIEVTGDVANPPALAHPPTGPNEAAIVAGDQIHPWLHQLETRPGTEILGEPEVTTTSDRQTQMRATEIMSVVAGVNPKALTPPGMTRAEVTNGPGFFVVQKVECGPIFDVVPQVMADGCTIHLRILATANEFEGYDKPTEKVRVYVDDLPTNGPPATTTVPAPRFDERAFRASVNLYDSQALMLTLPIDPRTGLPLEKAGKKAKHLLVLATVSIVDPAGNRVHADDELPFAHDHVPPQPVEPETRLDDRPFLRPTVPVRP